MKQLWMPMLALAALVSAAAEPLRVAVIDFEDQTGLKADDRLGGAIKEGAVAQKGAFILAKQLAGEEGFSLIDRRDVLAQIEKQPLKDLGELTTTKPTFLNAARALGADLVLRGNLMSLSESKQSVNQAGFSAETSVLTLRVGLEALDVTDGHVVAVADGAAKESFRQTQALQTSISEDDILGMMESAVAKALPSLREAVAKRQEALSARPKVALSVKTSADPALVEIDGLMVGTTPLDKFEIYRGDHVVVVSKPGYQTLTKRVLFEKDTAIEVPMLRIQLTAEELNEIYQKIDLKIIQSEPGMIIHTVE
jgi:hypothetical protein